jgi:hypothetical protein
MARQYLVVPESERCVLGLEGTLTIQRTRCLLSFAHSMSLLRALLYAGDGECMVAFCILHDSIRVCPDSSQFNMCILATTIHYGPGTKAGPFPPIKATTPRGDLGTFLVGQLVPIGRFHQMSYLFTRLILAKPCLHQCVIRPLRVPRGAVWLK